MLPKEIGIVMLSATVENVDEFGDWVSRTTLKPLNIIRTYKRPVPLNHYLFMKEEILIKHHDQPVDEFKLRQITAKIEAEKINAMKKKILKREEMMQKKRELMEKSNQRDRVRKITRSKTNKNRLYFNDQAKKVPIKEEKHVGLLDQ